MVTSAQLLRVAGKMTDREAAALLGCHLTTVQRYRTSRGMRGSPGRPSKLRSDAVPLLGMMPDTIIAAQYEVAMSTVRRWRHECGAKAYRGPRKVWNQSTKYKGNPNGRRRAA